MVGGWAGYNITKPRPILATSDPGFSDFQSFCIFYDLLPGARDPFPHKAIVPEAHLHIAYSFLYISECSQRCVLSFHVIRESA